MPVLNAIAAFAGEIAEWRQHLHAHPEIAWQEHETAAFVAERLREFGVDEVHTGVGGTGVVGVVHGRGGKARSAAEAIGLRADMDALPITEATRLPYASQNAGRMHACGHDGHTAMLLAAARQLAQTRAFAGSAVLVFQPAEEDGPGAEAMLRDGLIERFPMRAIFALHCRPGLKVGSFAGRPGPFLAALTDFDVRIRGRGGHAAEPHGAADPVLALAQVIVALQSVVARNLPPQETAALSVTRIAGGTATNVIPDEASFAGTLRSFSPAIQERLRRRLSEISEGVAAALGCRAEVSFDEGYPVLVNAPAETDFALAVAAEVAGAAQVEGNFMPWPGAEDFACFLRRLPGAYLLVGNGDTAPLHHPGFDFADAAAPYGASYLVRLVERALPLAPGA